MIGASDIASRFQHTEPDLAERIRDPRTTFEEIPLPFLRAGQRFVEITTRTGRYPTRFPVLLVGNEAVYLADRPDELMRVARTSSFRFDSPDAVVAYVAQLLRLGQPYSRRLTILNRLTDVPVINRPSPEEQARYDGLAVKFANVVRPPSVGMQNGVATGRLFAVRAQDLVGVTFKVPADGAAELKLETLERDLPIDLQQ